MGAEPRDSSIWLTMKGDDMKCKCPRGTVVFGKSTLCTDPQYVKDRRKFDAKGVLRGRGCRCNPENDNFDNLPPDCEDKNPTGYKSKTGSPLTCTDLRIFCERPGFQKICPKTCKANCAPPRPAAVRPSSSPEPAWRFGSLFDTLKLVDSRPSSKLT